MHFHRLPLFCKSKRVVTLQGLKQDCGFCRIGVAYRRARHEACVRELPAKTQNPWRAALQKGNFDHSGGFWRHTQTQDLPLQHGTVFCCAGSWKGCKARGSTAVTGRLFGLGRGNQQHPLGPRQLKENHQNLVSKWLKPRTMERITKASAAISG